MDDRIMPLVTFRCAEEGCGEQVSVRLTDFRRRVGKPDTMKPHPKHDGKPMTPVQIDYWTAD